MRDVHPPACPHPECGGRTFKNTTRLRDHLKVHEQREIDIVTAPPSEDELPPVIAEAFSRKRKRRRSARERERENRGAVGDAAAYPTDPAGLTSPASPDDAADAADVADADYKPSPSPTTSPPRKLPRLLTGETGKDWACGSPGCGKAFKTKFARDEHAQAAHTRARHRCPGCDRAYRRPVSLRRHLAEGWCGGRTPDGGSTPGTRSKAEAPGTPTTPISRPRTPKSKPAADEGSLLTGAASLPGGSTHRRWACPFTDEEGVCGYRFHRVYDVRRHLASAHDVNIDDMATREMLLADGQTGDD
jgi:hypothetical protein